jgi:UDP-2,4-diacetamido-2,4,6-trideoxy-beta-L-altropyranose hydrolase
VRSVAAVSSRRVVFRTDASAVIGSGHVVRCLTLADQLSSRGFECSFVCREHPGHLNELIRSRGYRVYALTLVDDMNRVGNERLSELPSHSAWLGTTWQRDLEETRLLLGEAVIELMVVDHYALDHRWESGMRDRCGRILVIDDLADRVHHCDCLLDQNLVAGWRRRYRELIPKNAIALLGPHYALLQPQYSYWRERTATRKGAVRRVLIYFGGADNANLTGMAVAAVSAIGSPDIAIDVVINPRGTHVDEVRRFVQGVPNVRLHEQLQSLASLMAAADLCIGGSGATSWERCALGLPSVVVSLAENQRPIAEELDRCGAVRWIGHLGEVGETEFSEAIRIYLINGLEPAWSDRCRALVDGNGTDRVVATLLLSPEQTCLLGRHAVIADASTVMRWQSQHRDDAAVGSPDEFLRQIRSPDSCQMILVESVDHLPLSLVRFDRYDEHWEVNVVNDSLAGNMRDRCVATGILTLRRAVAPSLAVAIRAAEEGGSKKGLEHKLSISICTDATSWINEAVSDLVSAWVEAGHDVCWTHVADSLPGGDICFFLSYGKIVGAEVRGRYRNCLVVHASDLPKGRGWSPASWLILKGENKIPVTLFEAVDEIDAGDIYLQEWIQLDGTELIDAWRRYLSEATSRLAAQFVASFPGILTSARAQSGVPSFYTRRRREDSRLSADRSLGEQFNQLRIVDNDSYPAYFEWLGEEYVLHIHPRKQN